MFPLENKIIKNISLMIITAFLIILMLPVLSELLNIIFKLGEIIGSFIRTYGTC